MSDEEMVVALQRGIPLCARPFEALSRELGCTEDDLLSCLARLREGNTVRRFGAVFDTRRLGYRSALCAVAVPRDELDEMAARLTPLTGVTHCYVREPSHPSQPPHPTHPPPPGPPPPNPPPPPNNAWVDPPAPPG
ncbi:MAG: hypothetical protein Q4G65_04940, partial [bacterium]|nr:hypothetical protein [bacterium]